MSRRALLAAALLAAARAQAQEAAAELVMITREGCPFCARFEAELGPVYPKTPEGRRAPLRRVDVSADPGIALKAPARFTPTFLLAKDGVEIGRVVGYASDEAFWSAIAPLVARLDAP